MISNFLVQIAGESIRPEKTTLLGPVQVIPKEYPKVRCRCVDVGQPSDNRELERLAGQLRRELFYEATDRVIAYRGLGRWIRTFEPIKLQETGYPAPDLKPGGVYLITGGLGGIGLVLAQHLAKTVQANLILTCRSQFPARADWKSWLAMHDENDSISRKVQKLQGLEAAGARCLVLTADVTSELQMQGVIDSVHQRFGEINGVIHAAGVPAGGMIQRKTRDSLESVLAPKVTGTLVLNRLLANSNLDFFVLASSISAFLGEFGQVDYCAANAFLDAFAQSKTSVGTRIVSINWDTWEEVGMAAESKAMLPADIAKSDSLGPRILPREGIEAFHRIMANGLEHVIVATHDFDTYMAGSESSDSRSVESKLASGKEPHGRPDISQPYAAPRTETEQEIAKIWQELLGISPIGVDDDFFELGGHSLLATQLLSRVRDAFEVKPTLGTFFDAPTVAGVAEQVESQQLEQLSDIDSDQLLAEVKNLSDEEIKRMLTQNGQP